MKLGIDSYSVRNAGLDPIGVLQLAHRWGLAGVLFELSPFRSFRDQDLAVIRGTAEDLGLYLHFGMGSIFSWHPMATQGRELLAAAGYAADASEAQVVIDHLHVAQKLGSPLLRCVAGNLFTRDQGYDMATLADRAVAILREACRAAEDLGLKIAMENHADFTVRELASILARVASPAFGFTVDCANLAFDLDDPLRLAEIMAPYALTTHFKDYRVLRTPQGLALANCALGDGDIDLAAIAQALQAKNPAINLNIEIHSQWEYFPLNILEAGFFARHPAPPGDGLSWYLQKSWDRPLTTASSRGLPDGPESWKLEQDHVTASIRWTRKQLAEVLT
jgi:sugar phosphate isomerase/epimerase